MGTSVLPQRQENAGFAAVVARGGGPGCHGKHLSQGTASSGASATAGKCGFRCRCGKGQRTGVPREASPAGEGQFRGFRNGRKIRVPLPLWQGAEDLGGPGSASRKERPVPGLPQRQENAGFAAVVEWGGGPRWPGKWGGGPRWPGKCLPQGAASSGASATAGKCRIRCRCGMGRRTGVPREAPLAGVGRFLGFRNGRKMWDLLPLWQGRRSKGRRTGMPQRAEGRTGRTGRGRPQVPTR